MRKNLAILTAVVMATAWGAYFVLGRTISQFLSHKLGPLLERVTRGKVNDPAVFLHARIGEILFLLTLAVVLVFIARILFSRFAKPAAREQWAWQTASYFILVNVWLVAAMQTAAFWAGMFTGSQTANYTLFQFKKNLLQENPAPKIALLMGSSQTRAQLDENLINQQLGRNLWTTELHFPGSANLDLLLTLRRLENIRGDYLIVYLSENNFYTGIHTEAPPMFARLQDIPMLRRFGLGSELFEEPFGYGFFGQVLPLFHLREALTHRILGTGLALSTQAAQDASLEVDLARRAEMIAKERFVRDRRTQIQQQALSEFLTLAGHQGRKVILLEGQLNPLLQEKMNPEFRAQMKEFLRQCVAKMPHVTLVQEQELPKQQPGDYLDLTHVNESAQARFTSWMVEYLRKTAAL